MFEKKLVRKLFLLQKVNSKFDFFFESTLPNTQINEFLASFKRNHRNVFFKTLLTVLPLRTTLLIERNHV